MVAGDTKEELSTDPDYSTAVFFRINKCHRQPVRKNYIFQICPNFWILQIIGMEIRLQLFLCMHIALQNCNLHIDLILLPPPWK